VSGRPVSAASRANILAFWVKNRQAATVETQRREESHQLADIHRHISTNDSSGADAVGVILALGIVVRQPVFTPAELAMGRILHDDVDVTFVDLFLRGRSDDRLTPVGADAAELLFVVLTVGGQKVSDRSHMHLDPVDRRVRESVSQRSDQRRTHESQLRHRESLS
jgi:hypothetical protein